MRRWSKNMQKSILLLTMLVVPVVAVVGPAGAATCANDFGSVDLVDTENGSLPCASDYVGPFPEPVGGACTNDVGYADLPNTPFFRRGFQTPAGEVWISTPCLTYIAG